MPLPDDFPFSQGSLQDYVDCPRRFQLRYLLRLPWPALEAEPALEHERQMRLGEAFHRLAHQHALGVPEERLAERALDEPLRAWWRAYLDFARSLPATRYPEIVLSAPLAGYRLVAKLDLLALDAGPRAVIVDWKTATRRPRRRWLAERLQSRVYPYLVTRAGADWNGGQPLRPERVEMVYWFAQFPAGPERFAYDAARCADDEARLTALIQEIAGLGERDFPLTEEERLCRHCPYRSLCQRGVRAGALDEQEAEPEPPAELDLSPGPEQIAEAAL